MAAIGAPDTIVCSTCWTVLSADSHFCSACGAQVSSTSTGAQRLPALLSEANLFRMRARWLDAENRCIEALRLDPSNVDGHSLLGDIYRDQGKLDEAAQWYQLALDLNPASLGDKAKLAEVDKQRNQKSFVDPGRQPSTASPYGTQKLMGLPPAMWLQGITVLAIAFVVIIIGIAIAMRGRGDQSGSLVGPKPAGASGSPIPGAGAPLTSSSTTNSQATPSAPSPPAVMPPAASAQRNVPVNLDPANAVDPGPEPEVPSEKTVVVRSAPPGATEYEKTLRSFIAGNARLGRATLGSITVDPRHPRATVIVSLNPVRADVSGIRDAALKTASSVAAAALSGDSVLNTITVNVRLKSGQDRYLPIFAGDAERAAVLSLPETPSFEQMHAAFSSYWWEPRYAPQGLPPFATPGAAP